LECPNPLCTGTGLRGQRGWIYQVGVSKSRAPLFIQNMRTKHKNSRALLSILCTKMTGFYRLL
jgi:hypothetical protein